MNTGRIYVMGIGPGGLEYMAPAARTALEEVDVVVGYKTYIHLVESIIQDKEVISSGMRKEVDRCEQVLDIARSGKSVALISSGDAGIYGMAGILLELADGEMDVEVIPGISAANAAAACLGAPLMHDWATISLSDLLTDWTLIQKRLDCAAQADFVIALYNPKSKGRTTQIVEAREIMLRHKSPETVVGIVRNAMRDGQEVEITTLDRMLDHEINMFTVVVIGNSNTMVKAGKMVTPRGYRV